MRKMIFALLVVAVSLRAAPDESMSKAAVDAVPSFGFEGRRVFIVKSDRGGSPILLLHEAPGMTPNTFRLARAVANEGYTVYMPLMFGTPGKASTTHRTVQNVTVAALTGQFNPASNETPRIAVWLRRLAGEIHAQHAGQKMGVIGMCISGAVPVALLGSERPYIRAAVLSQPALPSTGLKHKEKLGLSAGDVERARDSGVTMLGFRFRTDPMSTEPRRLAFIKTFGKDRMRFKALEIDHEAHSVLTTELFDDAGVMKESGPSRGAYDETLAYLKEQLSQ